MRVVIKVGILHKHLNFVHSVPQNGLNISIYMGYFNVIVGLNSMDKTYRIVNEFLSAKQN